MKRKYPTIPSTNEILPYYLLIVKENKENNTVTQDFIEKELIKLFKLTHEDLEILSPKHKEPVFHNRIQWIKKHLLEAKFIQENKEKNTIQLTPRGLQALEETNGNITLKYLERYPEYIEFRKRKRKKKHKSNNFQFIQDNPIDMYASKTESSLPNNETLISILTSQIQNFSFEKFKKLIIELLYKLEYGTRKRIKKNIYEFENSILKGVIYKDNLNIGVSLYLYAIHAPNGILEAKKFQDFIYQVNSNPNHKFLFITNGDLSTKQFYIDSLKERNVTVLDTPKLSQLMIEYKIGIKEQTVYLLDDSF